MKTNWIVTCETTSYKDILELVGKKKLVVVQSLESVGILIVTATETQIKKIENQKGVISVEKERKISI